MRERCDMEMCVFGGFDGVILNRERYIMPECAIHFEVLDLFPTLFLAISYGQFKNILGWSRIIDLNICFLVN